MFPVATSRLLSVLRGTSRVSWRRRRRERFNSHLVQGEAVGEEIRPTAARARRSCSATRTDYGPNAAWMTLLVELPASQAATALPPGLTATCG